MLDAASSTEASGTALPGTTDGSSLLPPTDFGWSGRLEAAGIPSEKPFARRRQSRPRRAFAATELIELMSDWTAGRRQD